MAPIYFDSNVCIGKRGPIDPRELWRSEDFLAAMDQAGISGALVYSGWAKDYAPAYGNELLAEELKKYPRFYGCYTIGPGITGSFLPPEEIIADMRAKNMVAAKMFPVTQFYSPCEEVMGGYYQVLEENGVLLLIDKAQISWQDLSSLLQNHPRLNVLFQGASWSDFHNLAAFLDKYPNLYTDLSNMQANFAVEIIAEKFGAHRICMGSGLPLMCAGAARAFIDYGRLSDEDKQRLAGGNLARLCGVELPEAVEIRNDWIAKQAAEGKPLEVPVFDSHTHFLEDGGNCGGGFSMVKGDLENMRQLSDEMGVDEYAVAPWLGIWTDCEAGNRIAVDMAKRDSRVYPYTLINPTYGTDVEKEAYHYHVELKTPAMKMFYSRTAVRYNDPVFDPWYKIANENKLFALMDSGGYPMYLSDMAEVAEKYPDITFFLDHAGRNFAIAQSYAALAKKYDNVYLQLTYTSVPQGLIEYLCAEGLAHKTLYGTDAPMRDPRPQLGWVAFANISEEDKKLILGGNMRRIAARCFT